MIKKLILLAGLLSSVVSFAQKIEAIIYLSNGTSKNGFADYVDFKTKEVKFRADKNSDKEKIKTNNIKKIIYTGDKDDARKIAENIGNYWFYKIHEGEISLYMMMQGFYDPRSRVSDNSVAYYLTYKDDLATMKPIMMLITTSPFGINFGKDKMTLGMARNFFSDKCPKLVEELEKGNIKVKRDPFPIIEYYEKNCQTLK